jgi:hypothetical protein
VATAEKAKPEKDPRSAIGRINEQNLKKGLITGPSVATLAKLGGGVFDPLGAFKADQSGIARSMLTPGLGGIAGQANFLAKQLGKGPTKREQDAFTNALMTPGIAGVAAQAKLIGQQLTPKGLFRGTEADAARILGRREKRERDKGVDVFGLGRFEGATPREAFKSEFVGLEDFAKKIQTNIMGGGEDDARKTARNTERTAKAVETLASKAANGPVVGVMGP